MHDAAAGGQMMASSCVPRSLRQLASKRRKLWLFVTPVQAFDPLHALHTLTGTRGSHGGACRRG